MDENFLKIGDEILLHSDSAHGFLSSLSFNSREIYLQQCSKLHNSHIFNMRNMVFRVMPRLSYEAIRSARREMKLKLQREENPDDRRSTPSGEEILQ